MGAAVTHLNKLDRVQDPAQRIGNFRVESLNCRREASAAAFALKMMSGSCKGALNEHVPVTYLPQNTSKRTSRHTLQGLQIKPVTNTKSLNTFRHGFLGALPLIWSKIPQELVLRGQEKEWLKIKKQCIKYLTLKCSATECRILVKSKLSIRAKPFVPHNTDMNMYHEYLRMKNDGILII